jgi:hypothetical protein
VLRQQILSQNQPKERSREILRKAAGFGVGRRSAGTNPVWDSDAFLDPGQIDVVLFDLLIEGASGNSEAPGSDFNFATLFV